MPALLSTKLIWAYLFLQQQILLLQFLMGHTEKISFVHCFLQHLQLVAKTQKFGLGVLQLLIKQPSRLSTADSPQVNYNFVNNKFLSKLFAYESSKGQEQKL